MASVSQTETCLNTRVDTNQDTDPISEQDIAEPLTVEENLIAMKHMTESSRKRQNEQLVISVVDDSGLDKSLPADMTFDEMNISQRRTSSV